jgi:hypothetical protein
MAPGSSKRDSSRGAFAKLKARKSLTSSLPSGIALGDTVVCTWTFDRCFGDGGKGRFVGKLVDVVDGSIKVRSTDDVLFEYPLRLVRVAKK